jgi:hypothetical protein
MRRAFIGVPVPVMALVFALVMTVVLATGLALPGEARADDIKFQKILRNGLYGGAVGALVGGALLAFKDHPGDHLDFVTIGAASGVLVGVAWGIYDSTTDNPYVMLEHGRVHAALAAPTVRVDYPSAADRTLREAVLGVNLVGVRF